MVTDTPGPKVELTYESIIEHILDLLKGAGALPAFVGPVPWASFLRLSDLVHGAFEVPSTTFTPIMRRLLFALGFAARPGRVVGVGTYVGYTFSWLLRDRSDPGAAPYFDSAVGIDIDSDANTLARHNCAALNHGERLTFIDSDGVAWAMKLKEDIDLLYLDLDDPTTGKRAYLDALVAFSPRLRPGALVLAHDPCVKLFEADFVAYHQYIRDSGLFDGPWVLPVDPCGLSVAVVHRAWE